MSKTAEIHKSQAPERLNFGFYICSTSRYEKMRRGESTTDVSGDLIESLLTAAGHRLLFRKTIPDDKRQIEKGMRDALVCKGLNLLIFCGGTGITRTDVTIETVSPFLEKTLPGFGEIFRRLSFDKIGSAAVLSRAIAGTVKGMVVFCIPGSPDAVRLCVEKLILPEAGHAAKHALE